MMKYGMTRLLLVANRIQQNFIEHTTTSSTVKYKGFEFNMTRHQLPVYTSDMLLKTGHWFTPSNNNYTILYTCQTSTAELAQPYIFRRIGLISVLSLIR